MTGKWLIPSLNRPVQLMGFFDAYLETNGTTPGLVLVDKNDPKLEEYKTLKYPQGWELVITEGRTMGDKVREVFPRIVDLDWVGILNDDHRPRTKEWDRVVVGHITGSNVVFTNDGPSPGVSWNFPSRLCGAICFSGPLLKALGYMFPRKLHHFFSDDVWGFLFGKAGCAQGIAEVCVEHAHAYQHEELRDETFYTINGPEIMNELKNSGQGSAGFWPEDRESYNTWMATQANDDLKKIIALQPKQGIMIAYLSHDSHVCTDFAMGLMDAAINLQRQNVYFEVARIEGSSLIAHARNAIVDMFLKSKCQRLLFIDADQGFSGNHVFNLLRSNRPIIGGVVPHKRFPLNLNFEPLKTDAIYFKDLANKSSEEFFKFVKDKSSASGEIEVDKTGTGCMMIDRSVFDTIAPQVAKYRAFDYNLETLHREFFKMGPDDLDYRGEDWFFCKVAKDNKIPVFINTNTILTHHGVFKYSVDESKRVI